jgi:hypothetical protein
MWAFGTDRPDARIVRLLLERGASASVKSKNGETAIDWARKYNNAKVLAAVKLTPAKAGVVLPPSHRSVPSARDAAVRSLPLLRTASSRVMRDGGCVACHAQPMMGIATEYVMRRGWHAEPATTDLSQVTLSISTGVTGSLTGRETGGLPDSSLFSLWTLAAVRTPPTLATDAFVSYLIGKQRPAGNWHGITTRPPMQDGDINRTALAIRTLAVYGTPARKAEIAARIARAAAWLAAETPVSTEERIMQILGLSWAGSHAAVVDKRTRELLALQQRDGGWAQTPYLASDAYATGQVLFTLREVGTPASHAALRRGVAFLLATQAEDGSWFVKSRAMKIQPYFESGFPHGHDQWISQSATAWAAMALAVAGEDAAAGTR